MNKEHIKNPETEYQRQLEIEKYYDKVLTKEEAKILNNCTTKVDSTIISIGFALKSTDDLNVARLMFLTEDPNEESANLDRAMKIVGHVDRKKALDRLTDIKDEDLTEVENIVINRLLRRDYIILD
ncbi:MAG: hypothetical protein ABJH82_14015 [Polaribacter sp.]|uniref:hypothetical protein n=1 Tax=Polaribacter sp. TaxID=1920175 RepID=UPI00326443C7